MRLIPIIVIYAAIVYLIFRQLSYIRKFKKARAINPGNPKLLSQIGVENKGMFLRMVKKDIFIQVKDNRFYMNNEKATEFAKKRRGLLYSLSFLFLIIFFFVWNNF